MKIRRILLYSGLLLGLLCVAWLVDSRLSRRVHAVKMKEQEERYNKHMEEIRCATK